MVLYDIVKDAIQGEQEQRRRSKATDEETQIDVSFKKSTLAADESERINFRSRGGDLQSQYPFSAVDCYNAAGETVAIFVNFRTHLRLPVYDGAQNGDTFTGPEGGIVTGLEVKNEGANQINTDELNLVVSKGEEGVERVSR